MDDTWKYFSYLSTFTATQSISTIYLSKNYKSVSTRKAHGGANMLWGDGHASPGNAPGPDLYPGVNKESNERGKNSHCRLCPNLQLTACVVPIRQKAATAIFPHKDKLLRPSIDVCFP